MNWVRSKVRQAALLALFALAVQIVFSFGHFHGDAAHAASFTPAAVANHNDAPSHPHPDGLLPVGCAICATIVLAGAVVAAAPPPPLTLPTTFAIYIAETPRDMAMAETARTAFRSRAPPRS
jgi:hypothetical protein